MIFKPELIEKILTGEKTVTRRLRGPIQKSPGRQAGYLDTVQSSRFAASVATIRYVSVERERLGRLTPDEVRREGFDSFPEFVAFWESVYGEYSPLQWVQRIEFELVEVVAHSQQEEATNE